MKRDNVDRLRIVPLGKPQIIRVDEVLLARIVGNHAHITSAVYHMLQGELVKVPVLEIVRPLHADMAGDIKAMLARARGWAH